MRKLKEYRVWVCSDHSNVARILDPLFAIDYYIIDAFVRRFVVVIKGVGRAERNVLKSIGKK